MKLFKKKRSLGPVGRGERGSLCTSVAVSENLRISNLLYISKEIGKKPRKNKEKIKKKWTFFLAPNWVLENEFSVGNVSVLRGRRKGDPDTKSGLGKKSSQ